MEFWLDCELRCCFFFLFWFSFSFELSSLTWCRCRWFVWNPAGGHVACTQSAQTKFLLLLRWSNSGNSSCLWWLVLWKIHIFCMWGFIFERDFCCSLFIFEGIFSGPFFFPSPPQKKRKRVESVNFLWWNLRQPRQMLENVKCSAGHVACLV